MTSAPEPASPLVRPFIKSHLTRIVSIPANGRMISVDMDFEDLVVRGDFIPISIDGIDCVLLALPI